MAVSGRGFFGRVVLHGIPPLWESASFPKGRAPPKGLDHGSGGSGKQRILTDTCDVTGGETNAQASSYYGTEPFYAQARTKVICRLGGVRAARRVVEKGIPLLDCTGPHMEICRPGGMRAARRVREGKPLKASVADSRDNRRKGKRQRKPPPKGKRQTVDSGKEA